MFLAGVLAQFDWADQIDRTQEFSIDGKGWLVGPYIVSQLNDSTIFEGRLAWGQSDNHISPFSTYRDKLDTERWFAKAKLTGNFKLDGWQLSPHVAFMYFRDEQKAYTDSLDILIPGQTIDLGRFTFGPKISTIVSRGDGITFAPHLALKGIWDFAATEKINLATGLITGSNERLRARLEGGFTLNLPNRSSVTGEGFYDGLGTDDFKAYGGSVRLKVPLQ